MYTIFLSSTFNDMQNERDAFHRVILPRLNGVLAEYGQSAQLCDLRWGVDTSGDGEAESTRKILDVCFDSIKTSIPFFVVMLGDRYGWVPPADVEERMASFGLSYHAQSVTEMEIEYHDIARSDYASHAIYLFRDPIPKEGMTEQAQGIFYSQNAEDQEKLRRLKARIRAENPGRVFSYAVNWDAEAQSYDTDTFSALATEQLSALVRTLLGDRPILTEEEKVMLESTAYFAKRAHLPCGNAPVLTQLFRDLLTRIRGSIEGMNEELMAAYEKAGKLEAEKNREHWERFSAVLCRPESSESSLLAGIYESLPRMELSKKILPVPFVAGISGHAQNGQQLLACLVRALEKELLTTAGISWTNGEDMRQKAKELIEFSPWERYPEGTANGLRYYLEQLLQKVQKQNTQVFLFVEHFERLTDTFARELQFLSATDGDRGIYLFLEMTDVCYEKMTYIRTRSGTFVYDLLPLQKEERTRFITDSFSAAGKSLPPAALAALSDRPEGENVTWLMTACEELSDLNSNDFARIRSMGDGIGAIESLLLEKINAFPADSGTLVCERLLAHGDALNTALSRFVLGMLSLSEYGISRAMLESVAETVGVPWNGLDFELLVCRFPYDIRYSGSGLYSFFRTDVRQRMHTLLSPEALLPHYIAALRSLTPADAEYATECISIAAAAQDADWMWEIIDAVREDSITHPEIYYRLAKALDGDGTWLLDTKAPISDDCMIWLCKSYYNWLNDEDREREFLPIYGAIAAREAHMPLVRMYAHAVRSEYMDRDGDHDAASAEFAKAFALAPDLLATYGAAAVKTVSYYAYIGIWYHPEEKERFATCAYEWAETLPHTEENFSAIVQARYHYIRVFEKSLDIRETNDRYQAIFDLYEEMGNVVCHRYKGKFKRDFFYDLHLKYMGLCAEICDRYATFLSRNHKRAEGISVPFHHVYFTNVSDGDFYTKADGLTHEDTVDFKHGAIYYRRVAIRLAGDKHAETHSNAWALFFADCSYRQGEHQKKIGMITHRVSEAYESYEDAARGYEMALRAMTRKNERDQTVAFRADAFANMGEVAKNFTRDVYKHLSKQASEKAVELYASVPVETLSNVQLSLYAQSLIRCGSREELCRAFDILKRSTAENSRLYGDFYRCLDLLRVSATRTVAELTAKELLQILLSGMAFAKYAFLGESPERAEMLYTGKAVSQYVCGFKEESAPAKTDGVLLLRRYVQGFCIEHAYRTLLGDAESAKHAHETLLSTLRGCLREEQLQVFQAIPAWPDLKSALQKLELI